MFDATVPPSIQVLLANFTSCFSSRGFQNFVALTTGWIACQGRHHISRVIQAALGPARGKHHSTLYRFLSRGSWAADRLGKVLLKLLLPMVSKEVTCIVDDTLGHKSGPHVFGAAMHYDAVQSSYGRGTAAGRKAVFAFGHNWVVLTLWVPLPWGAGRGVAVPILFRLYRSKKRCPQALYRKRTELAIELVRLVASWLPEDRRLHVVADNEYSCKTVVKALPSRAHFTGPMPMDAAVYGEPTYGGRGRRPRKGNRLPSPKALAGQGSTPWRELTLTIYGRSVKILVKSQKCLWYSVGGTRLGTMVVTRDPAGLIDDRAYFSTDGKLAEAAVIVRFARRWEIEVAFRNGKQAMGLQDPQNGWWRRKAGSPRPKKRPGPNPRGRRGEKAVNHTMALAFTSYALVIIWYLKNGKPAEDVKRARTEAPWYRHKEVPSLHDMLAAVRREIWGATFSKHPVFSRVGAKLRDLLPHWLLAG